MIATAWRLPGTAVAHRAQQHRIVLLDRVEHQALGHRPGEIQPDLAADVGEVSQMRRQHHSDHGSTWTSTDNTGGRSRTIGIHESPLSAEP